MLPVFLLDTVNFCLHCLWARNDTQWHIYIRSSGFNVAHTRIHILFYQFGCTSHCSILVLDLAQYVERFSFTEFNFISFYSICTTYLCHFHYFIILYQFFRPVVCVRVCLLNIENIKYELRWWLCERLQFHPSIHSTLLWIITIAGHCKTCSAHWIRIQIWVKCDLLLLDWCDEQFLSTAPVLMDAFHNFTKSVCFFVSFIY